MSKTNVNKSFAEEGLEANQAEMSRVEEYIVIQKGATTQGEDEGEYQQVGGLEPAAFFYRFNAPKKQPKQPFKILEKGQTITGTYVRTFIGGKFSNATHYLRLGDTGELVGLPGSGRLNKALGKVVEGSKVKIIYNGMETIAKGDWEGQDAHTFVVFAKQLKQAA